MPVPSALVIRFFQLLINKQYTEAERELERIKQRMHKTEWNRGYFRALYGMFLSRKSNGDGYTFFSKLDLTDKASLHTYKREFLGHVTNKIHADFDRGFFSAWAECMRVLGRMDIPSSILTEDGKLKTLKSDVSQATMENFIEED